MKTGSAPRRVDAEALNSQVIMTPRGCPRRRGGFTLIETIVTVGLLAVLAAFVVPTVIQKASAGDPVMVASDLAAIRTGLETFISDVKDSYPNQVRLLTEKPTVLNRFIDSTTAFTPGQVASWNGPYLGSTIGALVTDSLATGYTAFIKNFITRYDGQNNAAERYVAGSGTGGVFTLTSTLYAAVTLVGLTAPQAGIVNRLLDGGDDLELSAGPFAGANVTGRFRFDRPNANGLVVAFYLAAPITK